MDTNFGKNLKKIRKEQKISQKELANDLYFTHNQISDWETGRSIPSIEQAYQIANYFNKKIDDFIEYEENDYYTFEYQHENTRLIHKEKKKK